MLRFEGAPGSYVQYTHARACSILRKSGATPEHLAPAGLDDSYSWETIKQLMEFWKTILKSHTLCEPFAIAKYAVSLVRNFNKYYIHIKILVDGEKKEGRLSMVFAVTVVSKGSFRLLGIQAPVEI
ncbi:hypothetical protein KQ939_07995 [Planococcus sp. CP5-4]|nr:MULTISPECIES: DALR anticodon-binding domain-containing protein [unclassified Planococcus (in: firmicutes)]MBU9671842.1 hypothetical protein [Planococcus sp. CP5-4_YE]MBV0909162.1 hypothetical protein [Planococcus sp. CP5-4_UN]MBW6063654.1 hypothetical protein [Planococcus sp. CP5-4]